MFFRPFLSSFLTVCIGIFISCSCHNQIKERNFRNQIGSYVLDVKKTDLGKYKADDSLYKKLSIIFRSDGTFSMNMDVPFIYDSSGTWTVGSAIDEWGKMIFSKNSKIDVQFDYCCLGDSTFYMNSVTPKPGFEPVYKIYFKRTGNR